MWIAAGVALLFMIAAVVLCAGGGAWQPDDEEPLWSSEKATAESSAPFENNTRPE